MKLSIQRALASAVLMIAALCTGQAQNSRITVSGHITDSKSGETLIGAGVLSGTDSNIGAVTNNYGYYSLTLPTAQDKPTILQYSYVGYEPQSVTLTSAKDTVINIQLTASSEISEAVVVASRDAGIQSTHLGSINVPLKQIQNTPMLFGESDVLKAVQLLPGVQGGNEGFAGLYVRGGGPDENLIMLDGVPIYNVDHMLGLFSVFQPEAVKKVTLYKGSFPARYGGRVSSILDIRTNDGNMKETHGLLSIGLISDRLHLEGPIIKDKLSYSISARGMHTVLYAPIIKAALEDEYYNYYFYDLNGKITWRISDRDRLYFGVYNGADQLKYESIWEDEYQTGDGNIFHVDYSGQGMDAMGIKWGNTVTSVRWNHIFSSRLFANTTVSFNNYRMNMDSVSHSEEISNGVVSSSKYDTEFRSGIRDWSAKMDFDYNPNPSHLIKFGAEYTYHTFIPESLSMIENEIENETVQMDTTIRFMDREKFGGNDLSLYAEDDWQIGRVVTVNPGLRVAWFNTQGKNYFSVQPRLSTKITLGDFAVKAGYARMAQYVHLLTSGQVSLPTDLWVPITKNIKPVTSDQFSLGAYYDGLKGWEFSVEGYWKELRNILEYKDGTFVLGSSGGWESKVTMGNGRAIGLEFFAQKTLGKLTGWAAYTLAKTDRHFPDGSINNGNRFPYKYDRRHNFNINLTWEATKKIDINATWSYLSGSMTTIPEDKTVIMKPGGGFWPADYVTSRNNYRLPPSHRLNIGFNFHKFNRKGWGETIWNISVYNVYNQMNPNFAFMSTKTDENGKEHYYMEKVTILPILPSISYTFKF